MNPPGALLLYPVCPSLYMRAALVKSLISYLVQIFDDRHQPWSENTQHRNFYLVVYIWPLLPLSCRQKTSDTVNIQLSTAQTPHCLVYRAVAGLPAARTAAAPVAVVLRLVFVLDAIVDRMHDDSVGEALDAF